MGSNLSTGVHGLIGSVAMFLKTQFLESQTRYDRIFRHTPPPITFFSS